MNKNFLWAKTILSVYRYLERIAGAIDKIIMKSALGSSNVSVSTYHINNVMTISQRLIDLSQRKITLINLKVLTEDALSEIDKKYANILIERFFDNTKLKEITQKHDISMRSVFRYIDSALSAFSSRLVVKGFDDDKLAKMLEDEQWIKSVHQRLSKENCEDFSLSNAFLSRAVL